MTGKRTCFVISPIGEDGSPTRQNANDVFDLLIEPALEPFHFDVVRADKIPGPSSITEDVIRLVQEADLCIVDLTEHNPNVFYECGRRHENGKPAILIIKKGNKIPFDLAGIRTILYDISDPRVTRETVKRIQEYVRELQQNGFEASSSGATLTNIIETLTRIERKVGSLSSGGGGGSAPSPKGFKNLLMNPMAALQAAFLQGDISSLVALLPRVEKLAGLNEGLIAAAGVAAVNGEDVGVDLLYRALEQGQLQDPKLLGASISAMVQYYNATNRHVEGARRLRPVVEQLLKRTDLSNEDRAILYNQLDIIHHGAGMHQEALEFAEKAVELNPQEPAYWFNISIIYEKLKLPKKAIEAIDRILQQGTVDPDHLSHAYEVFMGANDHGRAQEVLARLQQVDSARAAFVSLRFTNEF